MTRINDICHARGEGKQWRCANARRWTARIRVYNNIQQGIRREIVGESERRREKESEHSRYLSGLLFSFFLFHSSMNNCCKLEHIVLSTLNSNYNRYLYRFLVSYFPLLLFVLFPMRTSINSFECNFSIQLSNFQIIKRVQLSIQHNSQ